MTCQICNGHPNCPCCSPEPKEIQEECYMCVGTGFVPGEDDTEEKCPDCKGDGYIIIYE